MKSQLRMSDVGKKCTVEGLGNGIIRFLGKHHAKGFNRAGIELDGPRGKHDGTVDGHTYFKCKPNHGVLMKLDKVKVLPGQNGPNQNASMKGGPRPTQKQMAQAQMQRSRRPSGGGQATGPRPTGPPKPGTVWNPQGVAQGQQRGSMQRRVSTGSIGPDGKPVFREPVGESPFAIYHRPVRHIKSSYVVRYKKTKAAWYIGLQGRAELEGAVLAANSGDFLIRMHPDARHYAICINDKNTSTHNFLVAVENGKVIMDKRQFNSLEDLVEFMRKSPVKTKTGGLVPLGSAASVHTWFVGCMTKDQAEKLVLASGNCDFVVRYSLTPTKEYHLMINDTGNVKTSAILISRGGGFVLAENGQQFTNIPELVESLRDESPIFGESGRKLFLRKSAAAADWYVGPMSRFATENAVLLGEKGDFLLRQSSDGLQYVLCVNAGETVKNYKIARVPKGFVFVKKLYKNMESIVRALKKEPMAGPDGKALPLGKAAPKPSDEEQTVGEENEFQAKLEKEKAENAAKAAAEAASSNGDDDTSGFGDAFDENNEMVQLMNMANKRKQSLIEDDDDEDDSDDGDANGNADGDSDDEDDDDDDFDNDFDEDNTGNANGNGSHPAFEPFRVVATEDIDGVDDEHPTLAEGDSAFVVGEGSDGHWKAVVGGKQGLIPKSSVIKESVEESAKKRAEAAIAAMPDEPEIDEDDDEDDEIVPSTPKLSEEEMRAKIEAETQAKIAALKASNEQTEEERALEEQLKAAQAQLEEFGFDGADDEDDFD